MGKWQAGPYAQVTHAGPLHKVDSTGAKALCGVVVPLGSLHTGDVSWWTTQGCRRCKQLVRTQGKPRYALGRGRKGW